MLEIKTALVDVSVNVPENQVHQRCAEDSREGKCNHQIGVFHDEQWSWEVHRSQYLSLNKVRKKTGTALEQIHI